MKITNKVNYPIMACNGSERKAAYAEPNCKKKSLKLASRVLLCFSLKSLVWQDL